ncbi:DUF433 domain-containing protein [Hymenobacter humi]|uniref:DUF433 domain-containing protein n=1 Tax=Hymenobacter humi TaxID=1411620 RepID=A0ABW2U0M5_9BACT
MKLSASPRITVHPEICQGQPTVRGLRYPVWQVLEWLALGMTEAAIITEYPELEPEDFRACLAFAAARLKPLGQTAPCHAEEDSEEWVRTRQSQWLAEQSFLKQLWERGQPLPEG